MTRLTKIAMLGSAILVCGLSGAFAAPRGDTNADGKLSPDEFKARFETNMMRFDTNHDGKISMDEWKARPAFQNTKRDPAKIFTRLDKDGSGFLDKAELDMIAQRRFDRIDTNKDMSLSAEELQAARKARKAEFVGALSGTDDPDEALLSAVAEGDHGAVQAMVARKLPRMLALATRMLGDASEAEDIAQEAFVRIWRQAPSWQPGRARFDTWLHRVAVNLCYDRLRKKRERTVAEVPERPDPSPSAHDVLEARGRKRSVEEALAALPDRQREAIVLQYYQELSNIEAAEIMQISVEALESLLARGRRAMRQRLEADDA